MLVLLSCNKDEFLSDKPNQALVVPASLTDFQAILDNDYDMNGVASGEGLVPHLGETGADDYYLLETNYNNTIRPLFRDYYIWKADANTVENVPDWSRPYQCVFNANVVLDGLEKLLPAAGNSNEYNRLKGSALFYRAHAFYQLAQVFAPPYSEAAAGWGIPLRLHADLNEKIQRATLKETYDQITGDLLKAKDLLPDDLKYKERPSRPAALALLARVYQSAGDYTNALVYADSCLMVAGTLLDYNTLSAGATYPFSGLGLNNPEVIFSAVMLGGISLQSPVRPAFARVDSVLYRSYAARDLRKTVFFRAAAQQIGYRYKGSYTGQEQNFAGLATDEMYLVRAECYARSGNTAQAMTDLNTLLAKRYVNTAASPFVPLTASTPAAALDLILSERRKELCFRGLRWTDLRRLNLEGRGITLKRIINGETYTLASNDLRYTYLIPAAVIGYNPGMPQNER